MMFYGNISQSVPSAGAVGCPDGKVMPVIELGEGRELEHVQWSRPYVCVHL